MTAPKIGGREMVLYHGTSEYGSYRLDVGEYRVWVWDTLEGAYYEVNHRIDEDTSVAHGNADTKQLAADAASAYLRGVALEILETVDPEAAQRAKRGTCRECKHHDGRYCCRRDEDCVLAEVTDEEGFCHRFERKV